MHYREDHPYRDDENWLCHVGVYQDENGEVQCKKIDIPTEWKGDLSEPHAKRYVLLFPGEAEALGIPEDQIYQPKERKSVIAYPENCQSCGQCYLACPANTLIIVDTTYEFAPVPIRALRTFRSAKREEIR